MTLANRLRQLADALPPAGMVSFTRGDLLELLAAVGESEDAEGARGSRRSLDTPAVDLTVAQVAELFSRGQSTVRTWLAEGRFPGAYRLHGREWRIPGGDIASMQRAEAERFRRPREKTTRLDSGKSPDLGAWRRHMRTGSG